MRAQFEFLNQDVYFDRFTLVKSIDNTFVKSEIQTDLKFTGVDHDYLFRERLAGSDKETGTLTHECENEVFEKDVFISHNEGSFDLKRCITNKKLSFGNPLDCLIGVNRVNIFDYPASATNSIQGTLETEYVRKTVRVNNVAFFDPVIENSGNYIMTLEDALGYLGALEDFSSRGFYETYKRISVYPIYGVNGIEQSYLGHAVVATIVWQRITNPTKINEYWLPLPISEGVGFYIQFNNIDWNAPIITPLEYTIDEFSVSENGDNSGFGLKIPYNDVFYEAGNSRSLKYVAISNTVRLNDVLTGLFTCTGLDLVCNFLGINPDGSEPTNKYYEFATNYCKDVKIVQSYDIIRESALEDSFGKSGFLTGKEMLTDISLFFNMMIVPDLTLGIVRWEHVSYFQTKGYDLTSRTDIDIAPLESEKELIDSELFLMAQPTSDEFYKIKINYNTPDLYKEENEQKYQVKKFLTDVFTTLNNSKFQTSEYESLFFLLSTDGDNIISLNNQFSINSIFRNLHDLNRPYKTGQIGDNYTDFAGFSIGLETTIKFFSSVLTWDNLFPLMSVKTNIGTFKVDTVEANEKGLITLKVKK